MDGVKDQLSFTVVYVRGNRARWVRYIRWGQSGARMHDEMFVSLTNALMKTANKHIPVKWLLSFCSIVCSRNIEGCLCNLS